MLKGVFVSLGLQSVDYIERIIQKNIRVTFLLSGSVYRQYAKLRGVHYVCVMSTLVARRLVTLYPCLCTGISAALRPAFY